MTNGEHSQWLALALRAAPKIHDSLRRANILVCTKELYSVGAITKDEYQDTIVDIMTLEGYEILSKSKD